MLTHLWCRQAARSMSAGPQRHTKKTIQKFILTIKGTIASCLKWRVFVDVVINLRYNRDLFSPSAAGQPSVQLSRSSVQNPLPDTGTEVLA